MANLAIKQIDIQLQEVFQVEMKKWPYVSNDIHNFKFFEDDKDLLQFLTCEKDCQDIGIDWNGLIERKDESDTIFGKNTV